MKSRSAFVLAAITLFASTAATAVDRDLVVMIDGSKAMGHGCTRFIGSLTDPSVPDTYECDDIAAPFEAEKAGVIRLVREHLPLGGKVAITVMMATVGVEAIDEGSQTRTFSGPVLAVPRTVLNDETDRDHVVDLLSNLQQVRGNDCNILPRGIYDNCPHDVKGFAWTMEQATEHLVDQGADGDVEYCLVGNHYPGFGFYTAQDGYELLGVSDVAQSNNRAWVQAVHKVDIQRFSVVGYTPRATTTTTFNDFLPLEERLANAPSVFEERARENWGHLTLGAGGIHIETDGLEDFVTAIPNACFAEPVELVGMEFTQVLQDLNHSVALIKNKPASLRAFVRTSRNNQARVDLQLEGRDGSGEFLGVIDGEFSPLKVLGGNPLNRREIVNSAQYFFIPEDWTRRETLIVKVKQVGADLVCREQALFPGDRQDCSIAVEFETAAKVKYRFVSIKYENDETSVVTPRERITRTGRLYQQLPVQGLVEVKNENLTMPAASLPPSPTPEDRLNYSYAVHRKLEQRRIASCRRGICDEVYLGFVRFPEFARPGPVSLGSQMVASVLADAPLSDEHAAHEWGHAFGVGHLEDDPCGGEPSGPGFSPIRDPWPYVLNTAAGPRPIISKLAPEGEVAWGLDRDVFARIGVRPYMVRRPEQNNDFMSYCSPGWASTPTYKRLKDIIALTLQNPPGPGASDVAGRFTSEYFEIRGGIESDGAVELAPVHTSMFPDGAETYHYGDHLVRTRNAANQIIDEVPFSLEPTPQDAGNGFPTAAIFSVAVPFSDDMQSIEIVDAEGTVTPFPRSDRIPVLIPLSPSQNDVLSGETVLEWDGLDADGDLLTYMVEYSADSRETLTLLDVDIEDNVFAVDVDELPSSDEAYFRLSVSDGIRTRSSWIGPLTVEPSAPTITAFATERSLRGRQPVELEAVAFDSDDGRVADASIVWTSDLDGPFAVGSRVSLLAADFSVGVHTLTATATNSHGLTNSAEVTLTIASVSDVNAPAGADLRIGLAGSGDVRLSMPATVVVSVENVGSDETSNTITLSSVAPDGTMANAIEGGPNWNCVDAAPNWACTWIGPALSSGDAADPVVVELVPAPETLAGPGFATVFEATVETLGDIFIGNDAASLPLTVRTDNFVDLTVDVERVGVWAPGFTTRLETYVQSVGESAVGGVVTLSQTFPPGVSVVGATGQWWDCSTVGQTVTCTWTGPAVEPGATLPPIVVEALVEDDGGAFVDVTTSVATPGDGDPSNDSQFTSGDIVNFVGTEGDLGMYVDPIELVYRGERTAYHVVVENRGFAKDVGPVNVDVALPSDVSFAFNTGSGWTCLDGGTSASCTWEGGVVGTRRSLPLLVVYLDVSETAVSPVEIAFERTAPIDADPSNDFRLMASAVESIRNGDLTVKLTPQDNGLVGGTPETLLVDVKNFSPTNSGNVVEIWLRPIGEPTAFFEVSDAAGWNCNYDLSGLRTECLWPAMLGPGESAPTLTLTVVAAPHASHIVVEPLVRLGQTFGGSDNDGDPLWLPVEPGLEMPPLGMITGSTFEGRGVHLYASDRVPPIPVAIGDEVERLDSYDFSPDGTMVVASMRIEGQGEQELRMYSVASGERTVLTTGNDDVTPRFSRDGAWIYFFQESPQRGFWRIRPDGTELELVTSDASIQGSAGAVTDDGTLYYGGFVESAPDDVFIGILRRDPDGTITEVSNLVRNVAWLDVTPNGEQLVMAATNVGNGFGLWVISTEPGDTAPPRPLNDLPTQFPHNEPRISNDGRWVATFSTNATSGGAIFITELNGPGRMFAGRGEQGVIAPTNVTGPSGTPVTVLTTVSNPIEFDMTNGLTSARGEAVNVFASTLPKGGSVECDGSDCLYSPHGRFSGIDLFDIWTSDGTTTLLQSQVEVHVNPTAPKLVIDAPVEGQGIAAVPGSVEVDGSIFVDVASEAVDIVVLVDLWAVSLSNQAIDCDGDGEVGQPGDDVNNDGTISTLDCHITSLTKLVDDLADRPETSVAMIFHGLTVAWDHPEHEEFGPNVRMTDLSPDTGIQTFIDIGADADDNGTYDIIDVLSSVAGTSTNCNASIAAGLYTPTDLFDCTSLLQAASTDDAIDTAHDLFNSQGAGRRRALWYFTVSPGETSIISDPVQFDATAFSAFASSGAIMSAYVPSAFGCGFNDIPSTRPQTAGFFEAVARTGGRCFNTLNAPLNVTPSLPPVTLPDIAGVELIRDDDEPVLATRPRLDQFTGTVGGIEAGPNTIDVTVRTVFDTTITERVTVYGQDGFNAPPFTSADVVANVGDDPVTFNVLANDGDPDGDSIQLTEHDQPTVGDVECGADGRCEFLPPAAFIGPTSFGYTISDGVGGFADGQVTLTSEIADLPPVAPPRAITLAPGESASIDLLDATVGAFDPEGGVVTFTSVGPVAAGTLACDAVGLCTFDAPTEDVGLQVVTYNVADPGGQSTTGVILIDVGGDAPPDVGLEADTFGPLTVGVQATLPLEVHWVSGNSTASTAVHLFLPPGLTAVSAGPNWACAPVQTLTSCLSTTVLSDATPQLDLPLVVMPAAGLIDGSRFVAMVDIGGDSNINNDEVSQVLTVIGGQDPDGGIDPDDGGVPDDGGPLVDGGDQDSGVGDGGPVEPEDGGTDPVDASVPADGGSEDAGRRESDAGAPVDSGPVSPVDSGPVSPVDGGGGGTPSDCGCDASGERQGTPWGLLAGLVMVIALRRRRSHAGGASLVGRRPTDSKNRRTDSKNRRTDSKNRRTDSKNRRTDSKNRRTDSKNRRTDSKNRRTDSKNRRTDSKNRRTDSKNRRTDSKNRRLRERHLGLSEWSEKRVRS